MKSHSCESLLSNLSVKLHWILVICVFKLCLFRIAHQTYIYYVLKYVQNSRVCICSGICKAVYLTCIMWDDMYYFPTKTSHVCMQTYTIITLTMAACGCTTLCFNFMLYLRCSESELEIYN